MTGSTKEGAIKALIAAQASMDKAAKSGKNPHFGKNYAPLHAVIDAAYPALHANGFCVMQPLVRDEGGEYVETQVIHESGEVFAHRVRLIVDKNDMQRMGSAITYARRYGLLSLLGIADEDDDGNEAAKNPPPAPRSAPRPEPEPAPQVDQEAHAKACVDAANALRTCADLDALRGCWAGIPRAVRGDQDVIDAKDETKAHLTEQAAA